MSISTAIRDRLSRVFPWAYTAKHDHYLDYGWKRELEFNDFHAIYTRNSLAAAAVDKTVSKTWEELPALWQQPDKPADTPLEQVIAKHFAKIGLWRALMQVDRRGMVGAYAGGIILLRDGLTLDKPVGRIRSIDDVAGIIPAWEGQLQVAEWDSNPASETYAQPLMYDFNEHNVRDNRQSASKPQSPVKIHPSRVLIWSEDGTINGRSDLEPGFNDLVDVEKIKGAGGEGFWKSSRGAPIIEAPVGLTPADARAMMGAHSNSEALDKINEQVDDFQGGFDKALMLGGFKVSPMTITLPQPKEFFEVNAQSFAASMQIPYKVLVGNITGERASTEDAREWARTCMSRRVNLAIPQIEDFVRRLVAWGALPKGEWTVGWPSLLDATPDELLDRAGKMSTINNQNQNELVFLPDEIRETAGFAPGAEVDGWDEYAADQEDAADDLNSEDQLQ